VSSFTGHLGNWAANHVDEIFKLDNIDALTAYVRASFSNENLEGMNLYSLIQLDQFDKSLHEYTQEFRSSYSYWKDDISVEAVAYLYIGGLRFGALRADLMTNWQASKYDSLHILQNDAAKNSLLRLIVVNIPRNITSATTQNRGKAPMPMPPYKRSHGSIGQNKHGSHNNIGGNGSESGSTSILNWGCPKDANVDFKSPSKSYIFDKKVECEKATSSSKSYDSWDKAKAKLTEDDFNKRRRYNACINCGEVGHKFSNCPKAKP